MAIKKETTSNRGMDWEKKISTKCAKYRALGKAFLFKLPTEWTVQRKGMKIVSAFPRSKSLIDYFGTLKDGRVIGIEAKRTTNKTSFALGNIKEHQFDFFREFEKYTNLGFYLFWFRELDRCFLTQACKIDEFRCNNTRKSIPVSWFVENSYELDKELNFIEIIEKNY